MTTTMIEERGTTAVRPTKKSESRTIQPRRSRRPHFDFGAIKSERLDFEALEHDARYDPVGLLDRCHTHYTEGIRFAEWQHHVACYAGAQGIKEQPELHTELLKHQFFERRTYQPHIKDVLRHAMLIGNDADVAGPTYRRACRIASRLKPLFDEDVEPEAVLFLIERARGLNRLYDEDPAHEDDSPPDVEGANTPSEQGGGRAEGASHSTNGNPRQSAVARRLQAQGKRILEVVVPEQVYQLVMTSPSQSQVELMIQRDDTELLHDWMEGLSARVIA